MNETVKKSAITKKDSCNIVSNMFLASIITFTAGCMCFEKYMPEAFSSVYSTAVIIICLCVWLVLSFVSGAKKKWEFAVFSAIFWIVPQVIIYMANDGPEFCRKSITMYLLSEFSDIIINSTATKICDVIGVGTIAFTAIMILLCVFSFFAGYIAYDKNSSSHSKGRD